MTRGENRVADITLCASMDCPLRSSCVRATTEPNSKGQSYAYFWDDQIDPMIGCYWPINEDIPYN